jgi:hypothetical protein
LEKQNNPKNKKRRIVSEEGHVSKENKKLFDILINQKYCCSKGGRYGCFASKFKKIDGSNDIDIVEAFNAFKNYRHETDTYSTDFRLKKLRELFLSVSIFDEKSNSWSRNNVN